MGLTNTQREYASEHHKVVSDFLETRNLPEDEYYDIVIFAYLDAVMESDCALKDKDFVRMANKMMGDAVDDYRKSKRGGKALSLDRPLNERGTLTLYDVIPGSGDICDDYCRKETLEEMPDNTKRIIKMRKFGLSNQEIAKSCAVKEPSVISSYLEDVRAQYGELAA